MHTTATTFDLKKSDVYACVADAGWITGHTYIVYGPLLNGLSTFMFESTPMVSKKFMNCCETCKINMPSLILNSRFLLLNAL